MWSGPLALLNLALNVAEGVALGAIPSLLMHSKAYARIALDIVLGVAGCVAMAWLLAPLHIQVGPAEFAEPGFVSGMGAVFAIALGRLFG